MLTKILERSVHGRIVSYSIKRVLSETESGFRPGFSTDTCLLGLTDLVRRELCKEGLVGLVPLVLQKVFDCADHGILPEKLGFMGVKSVGWFGS